MHTKTVIGTKDLQNAIQVIKETKRLHHMIEIRQETYLIYR